MLKIKAPEPPIFELIRKMVEDAELQAPEAHKVSRLDIGAPKMDKELVEKVRKELVKHLTNPENGRKILSNYPGNIDPQDFREAVVKHIKEIYGYDTHVDEVTATEGAHKGVFTALMAFNKPGKSTVLIPVPGYPPYLEAINALNLKHEAIPLIKEGANKGKIDLVELESILKPKKISSMLLNYPHNPSGAVLSSEERNEIIRLCKQYEVRIINDYPYINLDFSEHPVKPFVATPDDRKIAIDIFSLSKAASLPGVRVGFVNSSKENIDHFNKIRWAISHGTSPLHIEAAKIALPQMKDCLARLSARYKETLEIAKNILGKFTDSIAQGAIYFWLKIPEWFQGRSGERSKDFTEDLIKEKDVRVSSVPGFAFGAPDYVRFALVQEPKEVEESLTRVQKYLLHKGAEYESSKVTSA